MFKWLRGLLFGCRCGMRWCRHCAVEALPIQSGFAVSMLIEEGLKAQSPECQVGDETVTQKIPPLEGFPEMTEERLKEIFGIPDEIPLFKDDSIRVDEASKSIPPIFDFSGTKVRLASNTPVYIYPETKDATWLLPPFPAQIDLFKRFWDSYGRIVADYAARELEKKILGEE